MTLSQSLTVVSQPDSNAAGVLDLVKLPPLMRVTSGRPEIRIGLIDGPVAVGHPGLANDNIQQIPAAIGAACGRADSLACVHGTFVAGVLSATRGSAAPAICPGCTLLVRPIFSESPSAGELIPSAPPEQLAAAIVECIDAGARLLNLSAALSEPPSASGERALERALDHAAHRGVIVVAAAGNQGAVGSTAITRHPWVIPVSGCDRRGNPLSESNLGNSIGRRGLSAPGEGITSLATDGYPIPSGGTSVAAPFVTGAIALAWSEAPGARAARVRLAVAQAHMQRRRTVVPALLDAWAIHAALRGFPSL